MEISFKYIMDLNVKDKTIRLFKILLKNDGCHRASCDYELWLTCLPYQIVFLQLQVGLMNQNPGKAEKSDSSSLSLLPPQLLPRNLFFCLEGELFLWDGEGSTLGLHLRGFSRTARNPFSLNTRYCCA